MDLMVKFIFLVLQACAIASSVVLQGSSGHNISPHRVTQEVQVTSNSPSPTVQPNASLHFESKSGPQSSKGLEPSSSLNEPQPSNDHALPPNVAGPIGSIPDGSPPSPPSMPPVVPVQVAPPPEEPPQNPPPGAQLAPSLPQEPTEPVASPPTYPALPIPSPSFPGPITSPPSPVVPNLPVPAEVPPSTLPITPPTPPTSPVPRSNLPAPVASPPSPPMLTVPPPSPPAPVASPPSTLPVNSPPNSPAPMASPPSTLPINSPPSPPVLTVPPSSPPAPVPSTPSTLPKNSPPSPPTFTMPPPNSPAPVGSPPSTLPINLPPSPPTFAIFPPSLPAPVASPPSTSPRNSPPTFTIPPPNPPVPIASPPHSPGRNLPPPHPTFAPPPFSLPVPVNLPPSNSPVNLQPIRHNSSMSPPNLPEIRISPISTPRPSSNHVSSPPKRTTIIAPAHQSKDPIVHKAPSSYNHAPPPHSSYKPPPPSLPPLYPPPPPGPKSKPSHYAPQPSPPPPPPPGPMSKPTHHAGPPNPGLAVPPTNNSVPPEISPTIQTTMPVVSPKPSPVRSPPRIPKPIQALPPPPPNEDCSSITCQEPLTNTPPGTPCNCVLPMQVELSLGVALYTFFPLVSELAFEIAAGVFIKSSQVRIMGANADNEDPEKTIVIMDLVPLGENFDNFTAYVTAQRLWLKQVAIKSSLFGDYEVLYVRYPGLPPSPPLPSSSNGVNGEPYGHGSNGRNIKPLGVDVSNQRHNGKLNGGVIAIISFSTVAAIVLVSVAVWVLLVKRRVRSQPDPTQPVTLLSLTKTSGMGGSMMETGPTSDSQSFRSSIAYTGSAKTFSLSDMEKVTNNFDESGVLGEGGFGRVYGGALEDGTKVAVKVLKRDDQQGGREFLAEVEMLSRLHHRNLVRLLGICTEERNRCLVYELIANGSVESHLHGIDKETAPLDWPARLKIALGAARGLAYLHEDSSPRVIHRDFKSSNILLEHDFTPKVSDFGLARTALDEEDRHISTRVMGTFGYVAPEYAMTGHLLVKSDVYSYGVVLLELLTGRKPVDMSMPPGQENLVAWARPLLPTQEGLNFIIDPSLGPEVPFDSIAKVAAIASMCVQPEVSHRPFMGEVVQALKLVCNECDETRDLGSRSCSHEDLTAIEYEARVGPGSGPARSEYSNYEPPLDMESGFSGSGLGVGLGVGSYRMGSSSGPVRPGRRAQLWERMRRFSSGSVSERGDLLRLLSRSC